VNQGQIAIDVSAWGAVLGLILSVFGVAGIVGAILRLWIQPQVGKWIELAFEREGKTTDAKIEAVRNVLVACQCDRSDRYHRLEQDMERTESKLERDISEIKLSLNEVGKLVPQVAEVKARVEDLTKAVDRLVAKG